MNAYRGFGRSLRAFGWRLLIVLALAVAVSCATYAVSVSPVGASFASAGRRPPARTPTQVAAPGGTVSVSDQQPSAVAAAPQTASAEGSSQQAPTGRPPGRGGSLTRGLPELAMYAGAIGVIVLVFNVVRVIWEAIRRRRGGTRAPIFHHTAAKL